MCRQTLPLKTQQSTNNWDLFVELLNKVLPLEVGVSSLKNNNAFFRTVGSSRTKHMLRFRGTGSERLLCTRLAFDAGSHFAEARHGSDMDMERIN